MVKYYIPILLVLLASCQVHEPPIPAYSTQAALVILGNVQDAGSPHIACKKGCCKDLFKKPDPKRKVVSLGLILPESKKTYLFEATPDITEQLKMLNELTPFEHQETPDGTFLTHAHIGHYSGLQYFGKEAMNADSLTVFVMPRMQNFLSSNGPWSQLVNTGNIQLVPIDTMNSTMLEKGMIRPFIVPHRDEYSETVGYQIHGENKNVLFIPDIDKWEKWDKDIKEEIKQVDYAFVDGTFYDGDELPGRDIKEIPHPFVEESMKLFENLSTDDKAKIHFIHFNHTNPLLNKESKQYKEVIKRGFKIANYGDVFLL